MELSWNTPSGQLLDELLDKLPEPTSMVVFGSGVLQMAAAPDLTSGDVDLFSNDYEVIRRIVLQHSLGKGQRDPYIEVSAPGWRTAAGWELRAHTETRKRHRLLFPDPLDVLVAKLQRSDTKDLRAFLTMRPVESELIARLRLAVDLYKPGFDEEKAANMVNNTRYLWNELYGHDIDVRQEIIIPGLRSLTENWLLDVPDYRERARLLAERLLDS